MPLGEIIRLTINKHIGGKKGLLSIRCPRPIQLGFHWPDELGNFHSAFHCSLFLPHERQVVWNRVCRYSCYYRHFGGGWRAACWCVNIRPLLTSGFIGPVMCQGISGICRLFRHQKNFDIWQEIRSSWREKGFLRGRKHKRLSQPSLWHEKHEAQWNGDYGRRTMPFCVKTLKENWNSTSPLRVKESGGQWIWIFLRSRNPRGLNSE